ncbi:hypothetical protein KV557_10150 [Kitasatospora aureofaciens]|uniref:hypothetical protein n=1 Tax=Kitasatospora aureofaciens TaxID=1894 RepID=UPI001C43DC93|nr:hypothetical protein [Kitasatospora aureofaciens]MBV6697486.1 hypothetical protein [Kitasatospora aureofaciens]
MSHYRDPAARPDATISSLTLRQVDPEERARARLKVADMATGVDDLAHLLDLLGLGDRTEIAAQVGRR